MTASPESIEQLYRSRYASSRDGGMPLGPRRIVPVASAIIIALAVAPPAFAGRGGEGQKCSASACKVYVEPDVVSGGQQTGTKKVPVPVSKKAAATLAGSGTDKKILTQLLTNPNTGASRGFKSSAAQATAPTALGAVFDLGAGPTALLAILIATALGLVIHGGVRNWRQRRASG